MTARNACMKPPEIALCLNCGREFRRKSNRHKYCHWQCAAPRHRQARIISAMGSSAVQRPERLATQPHQSITRVSQRLPRGRYVYAWFNDESELPFYVGKGTGDRAWRRHEHKDGRSMWCQNVRAASSGFRVDIIRENLTDEGAMLVESALVAFMRACRHITANQVDPMRRQEVPPLTLVECVASLAADSFAVM